MRSFYKAALTSVAAVVALFTIGSTSAYAQGEDGPTICLPINGDNVSCVWFKAYGNIIYVQDNYKDGYSAVGQVQVPADGLYETLWNTSGGTDHLTHTTTITEGSTVYYRACRGILATHDLGTCTSAWAHGIA